LGIVFIYCLGALLESRGRDAARLAVVLAACVAVVVINPHGTRMYTYPLETLASPAMQNLLGDWAPPDFRRASSAGIVLLLITTFTLLAISPKRISAARLLLLLVFFYATLRSGRHVPLLALAAVPLIAERLPQTPRPFPKWLPLLAFLIAVPVVYRSAIAAPKLASRPLPSAAVDWLDQNRPAGNLYNWYDWGGYLIWRGRKVWIDGRPDMYGDQFVFLDKQIGDDEVDWRAIFAERDVRTVMITPALRLSKALATDPQWTKAYQDQLAVIYVKR
jgi:hypothetical protein